MTLFFPLDSYIVTGASEKGGKSQFWDVCRLVVRTFYQFIIWCFDMFVYLYSLCQISIQVHLVCDTSVPFFSFSSNTIFLLILFGHINVCFFNRKLVARVIVFSYGNVLKAHYGRGLTSSTVNFCAATSTCKWHQPI